MFCLFLYTGLWIQSPNEIPQSLGYLCINQQKKKGGTQVLADVNQLRLSCECILLPWEFASARMMNSNFKTANYTGDWKEKNRFFNPKGYFPKRYCTKQIA